MHHSNKFANYTSRSTERVWRRKVFWKKLKHPIKSDFLCAKNQRQNFLAKLPTYTLNIFSLFCGHYLIFQNYRQTLVWVLTITWKYVIFFLFFFVNFQLLLIKWCQCFEPLFYELTLNICKTGKVHICRGSFRLRKLRIPRGSIRASTRIWLDMQMRVSGATRVQKIHQSHC